MLPSRGKKKTKQKATQSSRKKRRVSLTRNEQNERKTNPIYLRAKQQKKGNVKPLQVLVFMNIIIIIFFWNLFSSLHLLSKLLKVDAFIERFSLATPISSCPSSSSSSSSSSSELSTFAASAVRASARTGSSQPNTKRRETNHTRAHTPYTHTHHTHLTHTHTTHTLHSLYTRTHTHTLFSNHAKNDIKQTIRHHRVLLLLLPSFPLLLLLLLLLLFFSYFYFYGPSKKTTQYNKPISKKNKQTKKQKRNKRDDKICYNQKKRPKFGALAALFPSFSAVFRCSYWSRPEVMTSSSRTRTNQRAGSGDKERKKTPNQHVPVRKQSY